VSGHGAAGPGQRLFAQGGDFVTTAVAVDGFPEPALPEVAFSGRSNVGKSSLLNALTGQNDLARTSKQPGRTQALNFFEVGGRLSLVDMPGYGFAKASKKKIAGWTTLIEEYCRTRNSLRRVVVLVDIRRGLMPVDGSWMENLSVLGLSFQVVLTKSDTLKPSEVVAATKSVASAVRRFPAAHPDVLPTSGRSDAGIDDLRDALAELADHR